MTSFRIYVEGSGDTNKLQSVGREAVSKFLSGVVPGKTFSVHMCGGRKQAFDDFCVALENQKIGEMPLLLVDAEDPLQTEEIPWGHLRNRDGWNMPIAASDSSAYLMVQTMEAWLICDPGAWKKWNPRADTGRLPRVHNNNVESISKPDLEAGCESVCKSVGKRYSKDKRLSGFGVLKFVQPGLVRENSKEAARFFDYIKEKAGAA